MTTTQKKNRDCYGTPIEGFYNELNKRFDFTLDPCAWPENRLATTFYFTEKENGLVQSWKYQRVFMNPPYSNPTPWVKKAHREAKAGALVVGLLRHDPSTIWWNEWIRDKAIVVPVPYRLRFIDYETGEPSAEGVYNFPSAVVIWLGLWV